MKTVRDFELNGKKVIIRCDFNVPIKDGKILDDTRIKASLKTIRYCLDHHAKVILLSHLGRIKTEEDRSKNTLLPVKDRLEVLLGQPVFFSPETRGASLEQLVQNLKEQEVLLVENTRYEDLDGKKESSNDASLASSWASLGDIFINDAFGTAHRAHASNVGIASLLPSGIGFLIEEELKALSMLDDPKHPYVVIMGGAKVQDKIGVIENLITKADKILLGGGMAFTFLKAQGYQIGTSLLDEENLTFCSEILKDYSDKIILPQDVKVSLAPQEDASYHIAQIKEIKNDEMGLDIGPETIQEFKNNLKDAKTIVWNGPLGYYELAPYREGTKELLDYISKLDANTILGGGDIVAAATELGYKDKVTHCSTGGGATLEYLEGKDLPGLKVIREQP